MVRKWSTVPISLSYTTLVLNCTRLKDSKFQTLQVAEEREEAAAALSDARVDAEDAQERAHELLEQLEAMQHQQIGTYAAYTAMGNKLRIVTLGWGTGRQKMALQRWTNPKRSRRTCTCECGLQSC
jgi:membrane-associated HD superfamily phosphohydrolase